MLGSYLYLKDIPELLALLWCCYDAGCAFSTLPGGFYTAPRAGGGGESDLVFNCSCE